MLSQACRYQEACWHLQRSASVGGEDAAVMLHMQASSAPVLHARAEMKMVNMCDYHSSRHATHTLSPRTKYSPSGSCSTPALVENTRSWASAKMRLVAWSYPRKMPCMWRVQAGAGMITEASLSRQIRCCCCYCCCCCCNQMCKLMTVEQPEPTSVKQLALSQALACFER
jgi:hypothetical protein